MSEKKANDTGSAVRVGSAESLGSMGSTAAPEANQSDAAGSKRKTAPDSSKFDLPSCLLLLLNIHTDSDFLEPVQRKQIDIACQTLTCGHSEPTRNQLFLFPEMISHFADIWCMTASQPSLPVTHGSVTFGIALLTYFVTGVTDEEIVQFTALGELLRRVLERTHIIPTTGHCTCMRSTVEYKSKTKQSPAVAESGVGNRASRRQALKNIPRPGCICDLKKGSDESKTGPRQTAREYTQGFSADWHEVAAGLLYYLLIRGQPNVQNVQASAKKPAQNVRSNNDHEKPVMSKSLFLGGKVEVATFTNLLYFLFSTQLHPVLLRYSHLTVMELLMMTLNAETHNFIVSDDYIFKGTSTSKSEAKPSFRLRYSSACPEGEQPHRLFRIEEADLPHAILEVRRILARLVGKREHQSQMVSSLSHAAADALVAEYMRQATTKIQSSGFAEFLQLASVSIRLLTREDFDNKSFAISCDGEPRSGYGLATINTPLSPIDTKNRRTMLLDKIEWYKKLEHLYRWAKRHPSSGTRLGSWIVNSSFSYTFQFCMLHESVGTVMAAKSIELESKSALDVKGPLQMSDVKRPFDINSIARAIGSRIATDSTEAQKTNPNPLAQVVKTSDIQQAPLVQEEEKDKERAAIKRFLSERDKTDGVLVQMILELVTILDPSADEPLTKPVAPTVTSIKSTAISLSASGLALQVAYEGVYVVGIDKMSAGEGDESLNRRLLKHLAQLRLDIAKVMPVVPSSSSLAKRSGATAKRSGASGQSGDKITVDVISASGKLLATGIQRRGGRQRAHKCSHPVQIAEKDLASLHLTSKTVKKGNSTSTTVQFGNAGSTCFVVVTAPGKATYDGEINMTGQFHGFGACVSSQSYSYVGWWKNGARDFWGLENDGAQFFVVQYEADRVVERIPILPSRSLLLPATELDEACTRCFNHPTASELKKMGAVNLDRFYIRFERVKVARRIIAAVPLPAEALRRLEFGLARLLTAEIDSFVVALWRHLIPSFEADSGVPKKATLTQAVLVPHTKSTGLAEGLKKTDLPFPPKKSEITTTTTTTTSTTNGKTTITTNITNGPPSFDLPFVVKCSLSQAFWPIRKLPSTRCQGPATSCPCGAHGDQKFMNDFRDIVPSIGQVTPAAREFSAAMIMFACLLDFIHGRSAAKEATKPIGKRPPTNLGMIYPLVCQVLRACGMKSAPCSSSLPSMIPNTSQAKIAKPDTRNRKDLTTVMDFLSSSKMLTAKEMNATLEALTSKGDPLVTAIPFPSQSKDSSKGKESGPTEIPLPTATSQTKPGEAKNHSLTAALEAKNHSLTAALEAKISSGSADPPRSSPTETGQITKIPSATSKSTCRTCDRSNAMLRCRCSLDFRYCDINCQKVHWPVHKQTCPARIVQAAPSTLTFPH